MKLLDRIEPILKKHNLPGTIYDRYTSDSEIRLDLEMKTFRAFICELEFKEVKS
jgi:hypothetical protein